MVLLLGAIDEQSKEETFEGESVTHQLTVGRRRHGFHGSSVAAGVDEQILD